MAALFADRIDAGRVLAQHLSEYRGSNTVVVGLPRGGVPVAAVVAKALGASLEICVVRKVGIPGREELAMGAVAEGGVLVIEPQIVQLARISDTDLQSVVAVKHAEVEERVHRFRGARPRADVHGKVVIVVDDGLATGSTARAALTSLRQQGAQRLVLAVPVASADSLQTLEDVADDVVCPHALTDFWAVGMWYDDFRQTSDQDVVDLLARSAS